MGKLILVFNHTENVIIADEEGHAVAPHDWGIADQAFVKEHLSDKRLSKVDPSTITSASNQAAMLVKQRYEELVPPEPESLPQAEEPESKPSKKSNK